MGQSSESKRGFAAMNAEQQRQIASQGGKAAHEKGTAHEFTSEEARAAGRKGGEVVSQNREHMASIGRKGAEARSQGSNGSRRANRGSHEQHVKASEHSHQG
ncbi:KGG domain-containing protein [Sorangium sp. So ce1128]